MVCCQGSPDAFVFTAMHICKAEIVRAVDRFGDYIVWLLERN